MKLRGRLEQIPGCIGIRVGSVVWIIGIALIDQFRLDPMIL